MISLMTLPTESFTPDGDIHGDTMPDADELTDVTGDALGEYLNAEVMMPHGADFHTGTVKRHKRDAARWRGSSLGRGPAIRSLTHARSKLHSLMVQRRNILRTSLPKTCTCKS